MSAIPPNSTASIIQIQGATARSGETHAQDKSAEAQRKRGAFSENLQNVIEEADRDAQVFADAEGSGSQGRPFADDSESSEETQSVLDAAHSADFDALTPQSGGQLDVQA